MKKLIVLSVMIAFLVGGCASMDRTAYQSLSISKTTYDTALKVAADLYSKGEITDAQKAEVIRLGKIYKGAHNTAVKSFLEFKQSGAVVSEMTYLEQLSIASATLVDLLEYIYSLRGD